MPHIGVQELLILLAVVLVLFGGRRLPELARGLGQGLRELKKATGELSAHEGSSVE
jgi:sec-independent protein translocase protein TatA